MNRLALTLAALLLILPKPARADDADRAAWMKDARLGIMNHYLEDWIARREDLQERRMSVDRWNELVDQFDVEAHAQQVEAVGAKYQIFTIGQNSGFYVCPNTTYDRIVGISPSHCSKRDLITDLADALHARGIKLIVYLPAGAPGGDSIAREKLQWHNGPNPNREFQRNWEAVIGDWSRRWGKKVDGWWYDGCYWPNTMYRDNEPPNFESFAAASRAGNPDSAVAFNPGVVYRTISITPFEDYTAGEVDQPEKWAPKRIGPEGKADGARIHMLSYLGDHWGFGAAPRFQTEDVIAYTKKVIDAGGAVTWDVPIQNDGTIAQPFLDQFAAISKALVNYQPTLATRPATQRD